MKLHPVARRVIRFEAGQFRCHVCGVLAEAEWDPLGYAFNVTQNCICEVDDDGNTIDHVGRIDHDDRGE